MRNIKLTIEYDGTNYSGWQRQKNSKTVQQQLEGTISELLHENVNIIGCSRTDAGVHARGFVANFNTESTIPSDAFKEAINSRLAHDIVILKSQEAEIDFHSRYSAIGKTYSYSILNRTPPPAIERNFVFHYKKQLNHEAMNEACTYFLGKHDFSAFKSTGSSVKTSVRTIKKAFICKNEDKLVFIVEGDGFLYNMVRIMVGTLIDIGLNKIEPMEIASIIDSKDRNRAGKTLPAAGLCLEAVYY